MDAIMVLESASGDIYRSFIVVFLRPLSVAHDPESEDVASAWNESIQRLGLMPLYPPTEDFYVGDVWAVIVKEDGDKATLESQRSTLVGKSVRIGYIDLRSEMKSARLRQPLFAETVERETGKSFRKLDPFEIKDPPSDDRIAITLAAFPGITITHRTRGAASLGWSLGGLGAGREDQRVEEIRIPVAESYGVGSAAAFLRLDQWCSEPKSKIYCTDEYVRRVLAFSVHDGVLATKDKKFTTRIQIRLVNRVFLTREIQHRRLLVGSGGAAGQIGTTAPRTSNGSTGETGTNVPDTLDRRVGNASNATDQAADLSGIVGNPGSRMALSRADGTDIAINEVFQRPVAFGFRAISIDLEPSQPERISKP
jgi:hypothetical protein